MNALNSSFQIIHHLNIVSGEVYFILSKNSKSYIGEFICDKDRFGGFGMSWAVAIATHRRYSNKQYGPIQKQWSTRKLVVEFLFLRCSLFGASINIFSSLSFEQTAWIETKYMTFLPAERWNITFDVIRESTSFCFIIKQ